MKPTYALSIPAKANVRSTLSAQRGRSQNRPWLTLNIRRCHV